MKNQTFGVEIEMVLRREVAAQAVATFLNGRIERTFDSYRTIKVIAADSRVWKIMSAKTNEIIGHENYKYTFRCWLLRLKLNGEEFKNTRMHLLKHLKGNTVGNYRAI